jgi:hypothetical protein
MAALDSDAVIAALAGAGCRVRKGMRVGGCCHRHRDVTRGLSMKSLWKEVTGPSAGLVQRHFVEARQSDLKRRNPELEGKVAAVLMGHSSLKHMKLKGDQWLEVYRKINKSLQDAELTINFTGESWFSTENNYASYTQMYERSVGADGKLLLKTDNLNPADVRARVDDAVTFPKQWGAGAAPAQRGLRPGVQSAQRIKAQMQFGQQERHEQKVTNITGEESTRLVGVSSLNKQFNPKTKQIFAALNYGRRPHGSSTVYGDAFLVLHPSLKANALYFGGDTFVLEATNKLDQTPYGMLASVIAHAQAPLVDAIIASCYRGQSLNDADKRSATDLLLEAHVFGALPFGGNLVDVCLPLRYKGTVIGGNAATFAKKHGANLRWVM